MSEIETLSWQQAVAILTAERELAVTAVAIIKRLGGPGDRTFAEIAYGDGRDEIAAVTAALGVAMETGEAPEPRADLDARLERLTAARETLGARARDLAAGAPGPALDLLARTLPSLLSSLAALWQRGVEHDASTRATIAARLDAARWPPFADIAP